MANRGPKSVKTWCRSNEISATALGLMLGDESGQVAKWINGKRRTLPLRFKVGVARRTGLRLDEIVDADELETARELFAVFARDATAGGPA